MIKLINYHHPPFVKHVLAPQNEFGIQKNTWSIYKSFENWEDSPSPCWEKFPNNDVFLRASLRRGIKNCFFFGENPNEQDPPPINLDGQIFSVNRNFGLAETPPLIPKNSEFFLTKSPLFGKICPKISFFC